MKDPIPNFSGFNCTINTTEDCNLRCKYDVPKGTRILMANLTEKNIEDIAPGDLIIAFDEYPEDNKPRKIKYAVVEDVGPTRILNTAYRFTTEMNLVTLSGEHPILNQDGNWVLAKDFYKSTEKNKKIFVDTLPRGLREDTVEPNKNYSKLIEQGFYATADVIQAEEISIPDTQFYNMTTSSRTFIANGVFVHNCYEINKKPKSISLDYCYKFIDLILTDVDSLDVFAKTMPSIKQGLIFDFIGGDSLIDVALLDKILSYLQYKLNTVDNKYTKIWRGSWRASISTNGTLFERKKVRDFCEKWRDVLAIGVSLDGCPEIHDANRIFPDGTGSMSKIIEWWPWYKEVFHDYRGYSTKATLSRNSIPYLYDSLVFLYEKMNISNIHMNFIMEDTGCTEEDYKLLDQQMEKCTQYVLDQNDNLFWSMIDRNFIPNKAKNLPNDTKGRCGSGGMPCLSIDGKIYPCFRWLPHTQQKPHPWVYGDIWNGFNHIGLVPEFETCASRDKCTRDPRCWECDYEASCSYCIAGCYAEKQDFERLTYICEITKIQAKWAQYYWAQWEARNGNK